MFFNKKNNEEKTEIEEITKSTIPFLEREKDITDLDSLVNRIQQLKNCIEQSKSDIKRFTEYLNNVKQTSFFVIDNQYNSTYFQYVSNEIKDEDFNKLVIEELQKVYSRKINYLEELIHTCEDELEWLKGQMHFGQYGSLHKWNFNFDPTIDHC